MYNANFESIAKNIPVRIFENKKEASIFVAHEIAAIIEQKNKLNQTTVLGLATGSSPLGVYAELIRLYQEKQVSFKNVITFNLDEYYPMTSDDSNSYHHFMYEHFFNHIDIKPENVNIPEGALPLSEVENFCANYDQKIAALGGIDIQLLGIGRSGHIGFNEPGSTISSPTRLVKLHGLTIEDATKDFGSEENVPSRAITMGIKTILQAKKILLVSWGETKAGILRQAIEEEPASIVPASFLQHHTDCMIITDKPAASQLSQFQTPWMTGPCQWNDHLKKKALIWLSLKVMKPILKLTSADYKTWGLTELLKSETSAYDLNLNVHYQLQQTITGWPGGKAGDANQLRPERSTPFPKRIIIFSPHPDDDVISMGGTLLRLVEQGHEVHVAYQTSGNIAVFDDEVLRFTDFAEEFSKKFALPHETIQSIREQIHGFIENSNLNDEAGRKVLNIKGLIRQGEARSACRFCGIKSENIHFLEMPFYETAETIKKPIGEQDIQIIKVLIKKIKPHQIFAAGDLQDPHGTHAVCLDAIFKAIERTKQQEWMKDCYVWLYRGAWQEWDIEDIEMAVPLSPDELLKKRKAIFKHQSQKDFPVFPGKDKREFWQRAEDRNRATAKIYDQLGQTEYEAIEAFKRYKFL
jgi:glucosamine-6-phosphate deaminase